jgi:hypothetical protein
MSEIEETRDEIRLSKFIVDQLQSRFHFTGVHPSNSNTPFPVDVSATNQELILQGKGLDEFTLIPPADRRVMQCDYVLRSEKEIDPATVVLLMLCGGMSFRSNGQIHPLKAIPDLAGTTSVTLLDRQLNRISNSPLQKSACLVVGTPFNEDALKTHLAKLPEERRSVLYTGGLAAKLSPAQSDFGPPIVMRDPSGRIAYNPIGHLEALRWFILSGSLARFVETDVVILFSYSNWGRIFTNATLKIANLLKRLSEDDSQSIFLVEVAPRLLDKKTGSLLVASIDNPSKLQLVKYGYGQGKPLHASGASTLMSTNTWYVSVPNLLKRLKSFLPAIDLGDTPAALRGLLLDASVGKRRDQLAGLFEASFPVAPQLIPASQDGFVSFLRIERDLDQLSLVRGLSAVKAVQVNPDRAVSLKVPADFENPAKLKFLFES